MVPYFLLHILDGVRTNSDFAEVRHSFELIKRKSLIAYLEYTP